jgi:hypothetical protein
MHELTACDAAFCILAPEAAAGQHDERSICRSDRVVHKSQDYFYELLLPTYPILLLTGCGLPCTHARSSTRQASGLGTPCPDRTYRKSAARPSHSRPDTLQTHPGLCLRR